MEYQIRPNAKKYPRSGPKCLPKIFEQLLQPRRHNYVILVLNELMKIFLAKSTDSVCSTEPAWLAYVQAGMPPSWAGLVELNDAMYWAKKISWTNLKLKNL